MLEKEDNMIKVLLTGAGFTAQFGAPLAKEIGEIIFNHPEVQKHDLLRKKLLNTPEDFESVYSDVISDSNSDDNEKKAIAHAIKSAYKVIDDVCRSAGGKEECNNFIDFMRFFLTTSPHKKIFFTLNQDLFIERRLQKLIDRNHESSYTICLSQNNIKSDPVWIERLGFDISNIKADGDPFHDDWSVYLKNVTNYKQRINEWKKNQVSDICPYIKLHGSFDLYKSETKHLMILGKVKESLIADLDLLKFYFDTFTDVLKKNQCEILVIGYSFHDEHINKILIESIKNQNSKIHIVTRESLACFKEKASTFYSTIEDNLRGYYSDGLTSRNIELILQNGFVD